MKKDKKETIGQSLDFNSLFRIKTKKGIFVINSPVNKAGMINMRQFIDFDKKTTVKADKLVCLGHLRISKLDGDTIGLNTAFDNIEKAKLKSNDDIEKIMTTICPDYADDLFKSYHAVQIMEWYNEITSKI